MAQVGTTDKAAQEQLVAITARLRRPGRSRRPVFKAVARVRIPLGAPRWPALMTQRDRRAARFAPIHGAIRGMNSSHAQASLTARCTSSTSEQDTQATPAGVARSEDRLRKAVLPRHRHGSAVVPYQ